jgi:beta-barrel assembly-enhancing protease
VKIFRALFLTALICSANRPVFAVGPDDLPDIGSPAEAAISLDDEYRIGLGVLREFRNADQVLEDPEITQYIDTIGHRLSSDAQDGKHRFHFVVVKDPEINAFAVPGGFVFVNSGLVLATRNESELAGVLAHEISHVTQRHIVRSLLEQRKSALASTAAMLVAILLGAAAHGGGDAAMAGIAGAQTLALAQQMSFSRDMESEADRVGMSVLSRAGFDPNGMPNFFEVIASESGGRESNLPAIIMNHPVTSERIAEARARVSELPRRSVVDSTSYAIARERTRVLTTPSGESAVPYYLAREKNNSGLKPTDQYGKAVALINSGDAARAVPILRNLVDKNQAVEQYYAALGQAEAEAGDKTAAIATFERAMKLFPRDVPISVRYGEALLRFDQPKQAHDILLDLFNTVEPTPAQVRQLALLANAADDVGDAYFYMSEYHIMSGDLGLAANQLQLALSVPKLSNVQRARFRARLDEIRAAMPRRMTRPQGNEGGR